MKSAHYQSDRNEKFVKLTVEKRWQKCEHNNVTPTLSNMYYHYAPEWHRS